MGLRSFIVVRRELALQFTRQLARYGRLASAALTLLLLFIVVAQLALSQTEGLEFEVVSIRYVPSDSVSRIAMVGGPGTPDPTLFTCINCTVVMLIKKAYDVREFQISGLGDIVNDHYYLTARVPSGTSSDGFRKMLQSVMRTRFSMTFHHEQRRLKGFVLKVDKKGIRAPKSQPGLEPEAAAMASDGGKAPKLQFDKDGFPIFPHGRGLSMASMNGHTRLQWNDVSLLDFAHWLADRFNEPVADETGSTAHYDIALAWNEAPKQSGGAVLSSDADQPLIEAISSQLGLQFSRGAGEFDLIAIDRIQRPKPD